MLAKLRSHHRITILILLLGILIVCMLAASALGTVSIPMPEIIKMSLNKLPIFDFTPTWKPVREDIIFQVRLPRVVGGALVGAALATAGVLFQGLLRNPLADPYIIGTSAGAGLGATIAMMLPLSLTFLGFGLVPIFAFIGALASVMLVYNLARFGGKTPIISMLLAGFVVGAMLTAIMYLLITLFRGKSIEGVFCFLGGSISVTSWWQLAVIAPLIIGGIIVAWLHAPHLNAFSLGEEGAAYVGIEVEREKKLILALGALLTAAAVSISGLVGFVGLVMPHAMRLLLGPNHRLLIPASALAGSSFIVLADLLARTVLAPREILIGEITALVGAPFFLYLLRRSRREYAF
jgi:iron complex transport system permease protein